jgi:hypothetical protein
LEEALKENVVMELSTQSELCSFPGANCSLGGLNVWAMLPFRQDLILRKVSLKKQGGADDDEEQEQKGARARTRAVELVELNYDYLQINLSLRTIAEKILGGVDWGFLPASDARPQLADIERMLAELRTCRVMTKKRGGEGRIVLPPLSETRTAHHLASAQSHKDGAKSKSLKKKAEKQSQHGTVVPALIEKATGRVDEPAVYIAVEFLYKFWDDYEKRVMKQERNALVDRKLSEDEMQSIMSAIIRGQEFSLLPLARKNAGASVPS